MINNTTDEYLYATNMASVTYTDVQGRSVTSDLLSFPDKTFPRKGYNWKNMQVQLLLMKDSNICDECYW